MANDYFAFEPEGSGRCDLGLDFIVANLHFYGSRKGFTLVIGPRYRRHFFRRLH